VTQIQLTRCHKLTVPRAQAQGWGQEGFPVAAKILEAMAGCELRARPADDTVGYQTADPRRP